jgi:hypothetical protein
MNILWGSLMLSLLLYRNAVGSIILPDNTEIITREDIWELYTEDEINYDEYQVLDYLYQHPLDVNKASISQLLILPMITMELAQKIHGNRPFKDIEDLEHVVGKDVLKYIKPFVKVKKLWKYCNIEVCGKETPGDNKHTVYNTRLHLHGEGINIGTYANNKYKNMIDKKYIVLTGDYPIYTKIIIGNTQARFGEGMVFDTIHCDNYHGVIPDNTSRRSDIQDGILIHTRFNNLIDTTLFYSYVSLERYPNLVLSLYSGTEKLYGMNAKFTLSKGININITGYTSRFDVQKMINIAGISISKETKNMKLGYEIAKLKHKGYGMVFQGYAKISNLKYWWTLKNTQHNFVNPHSRIKYGGQINISGKVEYKKDKFGINIAGNWDKYISTLIINERYYVNIRYQLSPKISLRTKVEYKDMDITRNSDSKVRYSFGIYYKPYSNLNTTIFYRTTIEENNTKTNWGYVKAVYRIIPDVTLIYRLKYIFDNEYETYAKIKIKKKSAEMICKYTYIYPTMYPHRFYVKLKLQKVL